MFVVPGVLVMGPVVMLAVAPHADLHLLFLVPAIDHGHLLTTPCLHGLGTWSYKRTQEETEYQRLIVYGSIAHFFSLPTGKFSLLQLCPKSSKVSQDCL